MRASSIPGAMRLASAVLLAASVCQAASAQIVPKQVQLGDFGTCLLRQAPRESAKLLRTTLDSPEERELVRTIAQGHESCVRGAILSGRTGAIRGAIAQAALMGNPSLLDTLARSPSAAPVRPPMADGRRFLIEYAQCMVATDPRHTAAFLRTAYSSDAERDAFLDYGETLKSCMPIGERYDVSIPDIRNQVAAIAWQMASSELNHA